MRCETCKQELPKLMPGDIVRSTLWGVERIGPIASVAVTRALLESGRWSNIMGSVGFIDMKTGEYCVRAREDVVVVHGYIHIDR